MSGTRFLHLFEEPFETEKIAGFVAKKRGVTPEEVIAEWQHTAKVACDMGTNIHNAMEDYIKDKKKINGFENLYSSYEEILSSFSSNRSTVHSELLVYNHEHEIAGTADLIIEHAKNNEFSVADFKTNRKLEFYSEYGNNMKYPIEHLKQCQHNLYGLQLSLYAHFYSIMTGKTCRNICLLYKSHDSNVWCQIPCNYMKHEVMLMLRHYKNNIKLNN